LVPDPSRLLEAAGITTPVIGFYDAPRPEAFAPLVAAGAGAERSFLAKPFWKQLRQVRGLAS
jgi:hypothetical protein